MMGARLASVTKVYENMRGGGNVLKCMCINFNTVPSPQSIMVMSEISDIIGLSQKHRMDNILTYYGVQSLQHFNILTWERSD